MNLKIFLIACGMALGASTAMAENRVSIAAVVGDDVITTSDIAERRDLIMATADIPATVENQQKLTARITQSLIDETLEMQEAKRNSLTVTDEELKQAIDAMGTNATKGEPIREFIAKRGLSQRSLDNQLRAQLAWGKVVQRKLRRNVSIAQDEVQRAQRSQAASPGELELRISALDLAIVDPSKEAQVSKQAEEMILQMKAGSDMATMTSRAARPGDITYNPPAWVPESSLPPALAQSLRKLPDGEITPPIRMPKGIQILQVLERKTAPKQDDSTEYAIKQITVELPKKRDKATIAKFQAMASDLRKNPGSCMDENVPATPFPATAKTLRARLGSMSPEQRSIVNHLEVGDVSAPLMSPDALRLVMLCEKIEPASGNLPNADKVRQELFSEKLELEAQKHLRNLRRDAFIDVKGAK